MEENIIWVPSGPRLDLLVSAGRSSWRQGVEEEGTLGGSSCEVMARPPLVEVVGLIDFSVPPLLRTDFMRQPSLYLPFRHQSHI